MRVGKVEHFLAPVAEAEPFHSTASPGDQRLHLLQTGVLLVIFRMQKGKEAAHSLWHAGGGEDKTTERAGREHSEQDGVGSRDKHHYESRCADQCGSSEIDLGDNERD